MTVTESDAHETEGPSSDSERFDLRGWRRDQVLRLRAKGCTYDQILGVLRAGHPDIAISHGTIANDIAAIKEEVQASMKEYVERELPYEFRLALVGLNDTIREAWKVYIASTDDRVRLSALNTIAAITVQRLALVGDAGQIQRALEMATTIKQELAAKQEDKT